MINKKLTILRIFVASVIGLLLLAYLFLQIPWVQNKLVQKAAASLSNNIGTEVKVGHVSFSLFNSVDLDNILVRDQQKDTLLYSKTLKLRLTDLFFTNSSPVIKYIGLDGTKIYVHRRTEKWNYQFLIDYFLKDTTTSESKIDIKKIDLAHFQIVQDDEWIGETMELSGSNLIASFNKFSSNLIQLDQVIANKPFYKITNKPGLNKAYKRIKQYNRKAGDLYFNDGHTQIFANHIQISQGKLWIENGFDKPVSYFDGYHIRLNNLNATIEQASLFEDTIKAKVSLSVQERSGLNIKSLQTNFRFTPEIMELNNLYLKINKSIVGPYYAMEYKDFVNDFNDYIHKVNMKAHFVNASVASDDIAFFAPELKSLHQKLNTSFHFNGTVDNFEATGLTAQYGNSFIKGNFSMKGIPEMRSTQILFSDVIAKTNYTDLIQWIPSLSLVKDLQVHQLGNLQFNGGFKGTLYDFVTNASIHTQLGMAETGIRLQFPMNGEPSYEGNLHTTHFDIGKLFNVKDLGWVNFDGKIAGSSFKLDKIKTNIEGKIDSITYNNYTYSNISTDGILQKRAFNGELRIKDPNINFISNLELDFKGNKPRFNAVGDLLNANFAPLNLAKNKIQLTGVLDLNFEGDSIDNFIGYAKFFNGKLKGEASTVNFDSLTLRSSIENGKKIINIASNDIQANIAGKFNIIHLPASVQYFMQSYLPTYIPAPKNTPTNQQFDVKITTGYFEPYIRIFNKNFSGFNNLIFTGSINTATKYIGADANIPFAQWDAYAIRNGAIHSTGNKDSLRIAINAQSVHLTDSFSFIQPSIQVVTSNDVSKVSINATSKQALEQIQLNGLVNTYSDGVELKWKPSYFILNQKKWDIENGGVLSIRKNNTFANKLKFTQGLQELLFTSSSLNKNALQIEMKNIILGDLTKLFFRYPNLEGSTNGTIQLKNILEDFEMSSNLKIDQFSFNNEPIGLTHLNASYKKSTGMVPFSFTIPNEAYNLSAKGNYNTKDSVNPLDATLFMHHSKFSLVEQFIGNILHHLDGKATGQLHFGGRIENPVLLGTATLDKASFIVDYTKVKYFIDTATIHFTNEGIDFGSIQVKDRFNRTAQFKGKILNNGFKHLYYDMEMNSSKIELLNMDPIDNNYFYGHALGKAGLTIKGPEENIRMSISADVNDSSHLYLPNTTSKETGKSEFIVFKKYGKSAVKSADIPTYNLVVDLDITANNKTQIDMIFDDVTGDVIKAVGNGRIKMRVGNIEPLTIRGKYNIESGKYDFNFQSFIKKPFELIPEAGNFIEWTGNPSDADIHVDARYTAERVSLNQLVGAATFSNAVKSYRGSVYVIAALRNKLARPDIKFTLAFPQGNPISSDNEFSQFISRLERDDNEILKQVSFLIVFNSFAPVGFSNTTNTNAYSATTIGINTISQLLTKEINKSITNLLNKVTGDNSLRFDVGSYVYNSGNLLDPSGTGIAINANKIDRQRVNLKLGRSFLNNKVIVNVGGDLDFNLRNTTTIQNGNFEWLPDVNIEFILTRDRKLRAILFNRNSLDINGSSFGRRNRQGISISYRKDFENFFF